MSGTLQSLLDNEAGAEAVCRTPGCQRVVGLDVDGLAKRYGGHVQLDALERVLKCTACGKQAVEIICYALRHGPVIGR